MTGEPDAQPGPFSLAVAYATIGRAAAERHADSEAILAYEHALPLAEAAVAAGDSPREDLVRFLGYLSLIGSVLLELGEAEHARNHFERAMAVHRTLDHRSSDTARDVVNLGYCHRLSGDLDRALQHYYAALDIDRALGPTSLDTAGDLNNVSQVYELRGNLSRAQDYLEQALRISRAVAPRPQRTATQLNNLGSMRFTAGRYAEARAALEEALQIDQAVAPGSPDLARDLGNLGDTVRAFDVAEQARGRALADLYSGLRVAPGQARGEERPDVLYVYEMFSLKLSDAVVVCSACQTARGQIRAGEGLVGMSRALFYAGANCLVVTLWPIPDAPTRRLMRVFHKHLRWGYDPADALSRAKQDVRSSHPHVYRYPYTWAGFIALGTA